LSGISSVHKRDAAAEKTPGERKTSAEKERKLEIYKGRTIPSAKQRGAVSKKEYARAIEAFGDSCVYCGSPYIEMHHVKFRSQGGRGKYRNLIPLCKTHHNRAHTDREFSEMLRDSREKRFTARGIGRTSTICSKQEKSQTQPTLSLKNS